MLHRYSFSNFRSFREPTEVDLSLNAKTQPVSWERRSKGGARLNTALAVIGANGSGKTSLLKPLVFLDWFVKRSFQEPADALMPLSPHFSSPNEPIAMTFEGEDIEGGLWRYALRLTPQRVEHEALYQQKVKGFSYVFVREWDARAQRYEVRQQGFDMAPGEARKARPNASLIATAAQYGVPLALRAQSLHLQQSNIAPDGRAGSGDLAAAADFFAQDSTARDHMTALLKAWDLGLSDVELRELRSQQPGQEPVPFWFPFGLHTDREGQLRALPFVEESSGTQSAFVLLARLLPVLTQGGLAVIDEFENDLHPHMLEPILDLFANPQTNPHGGQILFTSHAIEVLNILHKSQVMLVEKDAAGESTAWRMDAIKGIRNDDNFYAKYMAGAYGAVPQL